MDNIIINYPIAFEDEDLVYTREIAYQKDRSSPIDYDEDYFNNYVERAGTDIANKLNEARVGIVEKYCHNLIVDIGIGSGEFIESCKNLKSFGYDINEVGAQWLKERNLWVDPYQDNPSDVEGFTLWDTLEHMPNPNEFLNLLRSGQYLFVSLPTFESLEDIKDSKHYKPSEHFYYFTVVGMIKFMDDSGFDYMEHSDAETKAGREGITSFVFLKR